MAEALGYDAFYMSVGNTSAHQLGWPDSGTSMRDMVDNAPKIVLTVQIPVFADADTGYGDAISTHYTVREHIQAGRARQQRPACVLGCRARRRADGADREGLRKAPPRSYTLAGGCTGSRVVNPGTPPSIRG